MTDPAAEEIADELLHMTGSAITAGNFDFYKVHFQLPLVLESGDVEQLIRNEDDLRTVFETVQAHLKATSVADLVRTVVSAEFLSADVVGATYVTKTIKVDGTLVGQPFPSYAVIARRGTTWKYARCCIVIAESSKHRDVFNKILEPAEPRGPSDV